MNRLIIALASALTFTWATAATADGQSRGSTKALPAAACCEAEWGGIYIAASVGYGISSTSFSHDYPLGPDTYDLSPDGVTGTVAVGFDRALHGGVVWGLFADYTFGELEAAVTLSTQPGPLHLTYKDSWAVGGRLGITRSCCTLWYLAAGYTGTNVEFEQFDKQLHGYFLGGGVEQQIRDHLRLKLEYRFSDYGDDNLFNDTACGCAERLDIDTQIHSIRLGLVYSFDLHPSRARVEPLK